jgi:hypothetical protein
LQVAEWEVDYLRGRGVGQSRIGDGWVQLSVERSLLVRHEYRA